MMTARQIEKWWMAREYVKLARQCLAGRAESVDSLRVALASPTAAAALALIRLDELGQSTPVAAAMVRAVSAAQRDDGGWEEPILSAVCVRALLAHGCHRDQSAGGIASLARLQRDDGAWPRESFRRMPGDVCATAFILLQLVHDETFRAAVRVGDAVRWLREQQRSLVGDAVTLTRFALLRSSSRGPVLPALRSQLQAA